MSGLRPVPKTYEPGYPRELTEAEIRELLRPSLFRRFSSETLMTGALVVGLTTSGCSYLDSSGATPAVGSGGSAAPQTELPEAKASTTRDPQLRKKVDKLVSEVLGASEQGYWNKHATIELRRDLKSNPPIKYPNIPISFGNSYVGVFDTEGAREATARLFELYGITLDQKVMVEGEGYRFVADGYDEELGVGFQLVPAGGLFDEVKEAPPEALEKSEIEALDRAIAGGSLKMLVVQAAGFPNMDNDLYTPMEYYLASVVDYLNWIHGERRIDPNLIFGKRPGGSSADKEDSRQPILPGCRFEEESDLENWRVSAGVVSRSSRWSAFGAWSLKVHLEPGGTLTYTVPEQERVLINTDYPSFIGRFYHEMPELETVPLSIVMKGSNGKSWTIDQPLDLRYLSPVIWEYGNSAPFKQLESITISSTVKTPLDFFLDSVGVSRAKKN